MPRHLPSWIIGRNWRLGLIRLVVLALFSFIFFRFLLMPVQMEAESMTPTVPKGSLVWVWTLAGLPERGDIVALRLAGDRVLRISRVIALPGERVSLRDGEIYINDQKASLESFKLDHQIVETGYTSEVIGPNEVFVLGDNRQMALIELHAQGSMGRIEKSRIVGKVVF